MQHRFAFMVAFCLIAAPTVAQEVTTPADPQFHIDPPRVPDYERERKVDETKKYVDPILQQGVDISALELDVLKRRQAALEERVEKLTGALNAVILILNDMNSARGK